MRRIVLRRNVLQRIVHATNSPRRIVRDELSGDELSSHPASVGDVQTSKWIDDVNQGWAFSAQANNTYRIVIRTAWWRVMSVYGTSDQIGIVDPTGAATQNWILIKL